MSQTFYNLFDRDIYQRKYKPTTEFNLAYFSERDKLLTLY